MRRHYKWTSPELRRLKECYAGMSDKGLAIAFAPHPINSIRNTARNMGLSRRSRGRDWKAIVGRYVPVIFSVTPPRSQASQTESANGRAGA